VFQRMRIMRATFPLSWGDPMKSFIEVRHAGMLEFAIGPSWDLRQGRAMCTGSQTTAKHACSIA
jgi:hypothetical protein